MEFHEIVRQSIVDTTDSLWPKFAPELILCGTIFVMLTVRVFRAGQRVDAFLVALAGSATGLYFAYPWKFLADPASVPRDELFGELFTGMLVYDPLTVYFRAFLLFFAVLFCIFTKLSGIPDREDGPDFYCMVLGATFGMCLMASANHLLMVFLAVEMASVPSYALAAMLKGRRESSEAALKYSVYGAGTAGVMLYGISLIAGVFHTAHLPTLAAELAEKLPSLPSEQAMVLALGGLMIMVGLAFMLSAVPFPFWCPDVFEGASAEVNAFLSVSSKAAALALLVRVVVGFGVVPSSVPPASAAATEVAAAALEGPGLALFAVRQEAIADPPRADAAQPAGATASPARDSADRPAQSASGAIDALAPVREFMALLVAFIAVITCTFGNLAAYGQTNIKRLMAYSTIAHAGYMMLAVPPALAMAGVDTESARQAISALALYVGIYLFMNLGAFAIIAFLRNVMHSEEIADYAGLVRRSPGLVVCFSAILFSLVGIPPLAGFVGKFAVFAALVDGYQVTGSLYLIALLVVGGINTAISLFYYLRVVKVMTMDPEPEHVRPRSLSLASMPGTYIVVLTAPLILLFLSWDALNNWTIAAASHLF